MCHPKIRELRYSDEIERAAEELGGLVSVRKAAEILECTQSNVCDLIQRGRLRAVKVGQRYGVSAVDLACRTGRVFSAETLEDILSQKKLKMNMNIFLDF